MAIAKAIYSVTTILNGRKNSSTGIRSGQKSYIQSMENVSRTTAVLFFGLASEQTAWQIACDNYANADTLYRINQRRYELGSIPENEMLSLEISRLNAENSLTESRSALEDAIIALRSYLGIQAEVEIEVILHETVPNLHLNEQDVVDLTYQNNPSVINFVLTEITSDQSVASARANRGISARLSMNFGLNQKGTNFSEAYRNPLDYQSIGMLFTIPILDWGVSKGRVKMAESNRERSRLQLEQSRIEFHSGIIKDVKDFNQQTSKVLIAHKSRELALRRFAIEQRQYINGNITLLEHNDASTKKDQALRSFISELSRYWNYYYNIRALTGYDFEKNILITEDFSLLIR
ncbi:MAG: TolC family protein [Rikenellaceae bacterium]|nr:TolC family protein [Rikenellaceae bacterium]